MSLIALVRAEQTDVAGAVERAVALAGGLPEAIRPGAKVLLKPNVVNPSPSGSGHITDARLTEAVARLVLARNPAQVIIGEGSSVGYDFVGLKDSYTCLEVSGTADVARRLGLPLVDLNRDERVEVEVPDAFVMRHFAIARTAAEADVIIDLPVIKTHVRTGITCALKNMKGVLPGYEKKRTHQLGLDHGIVDLNRVVLPEFTVVDGLVGLQGSHTAPEDRVSVGCVLAGRDPVAIDTVCAALIGLDPAQVRHLQLAQEAGLGVAELTRIRIVGERLEALRRPFMSWAESVKARFGAVRLVEKDACTGCMGEMTSILVYLKQAGYGDRLSDLALVFGRVEALPDDLPPATVILGQCAAAHKGRGVWVPGCPPHGMEMTRGACQALGLDWAVVEAAVNKLHDF